MFDTILVIIGVLLTISVATGFSTASHFSKLRAVKLSMSVDQQTIPSLKSGLQGKGDADILVRAYRGEKVERTPVWLMRQVIIILCFYTDYV